MRHSKIGAWIRTLAPLLLGATLAATSGLEAQEDVRPEGDRENCVCAYDFRGEAPRALFRFNRARIGVMLGDDEEVGGRSGVGVREVTDGGPADRAGLEAGDVLLSLNGEALGDEPTDRLLDLLSEVEPGDTVTITYSRSGRDQTARVVTDRAAGFQLFRSGDGEWRAPRVDVRGMSDALRSARELAPTFSYIGFPGGDLSLVDMNDGLGEYFGVDDGVLVSEIDEDSELGLQTGDVIVSIDGRAVQDSRHARSIIASYRGDEQIRFTVVRHGRRMEVTGTRDR